MSLSRQHRVPLVSKVVNNGDDINMTLTCWDWVSRCIVIQCTIQNLFIIADLPLYFFQAKDDKTLHWTHQWCVECCFLARQQADRFWISRQDREAVEYPWCMQVYHPGWRSQWLGVVCSLLPQHSRSDHCVQWLGQDRQGNLAWVKTASTNFKEDAVQATFETIGQILHQL